MTEATYLHATRTAYDTVAVDYERLLRDELNAKPLDRAMLTAFPNSCRHRGSGPSPISAAGPAASPPTSTLSEWRRSASTCRPR
ncbi:hypothetical protein RPQ02_34785 [Streptomyces sp. AM2-3-1]|uniref:hypothetical protein n=1 Tax=Streptomyces sp. AM2-3-1 TaxID=3075824 RepID=UPI0028C3A46F|nr:hypothetical protein [Streptomyces sp. AM2-3-1]WNO70104.1 hypothetical protein RPQ02_34785 [Streptomyces sp. AM2-3-1]